MLDGDGGTVAEEAADRLLVRAGELDVAGRHRARSAAARRGRDRHHGPRAAGRGRDRHRRPRAADVVGARP